MHPEGFPQCDVKLVMKQIRSICTAAIVALFMLGCAAEMAGPDAAGTAVGRGAEPVGSTTHEPSGKANFISADGAFEVWFPAHPETRPKDEEGTAGEFYVLEQGDLEYFAGFVTHNHGSMAELVLRRSVRSTEERLEGSLVREKTIWFHGNEGREFMLREPAESRTLARYYNLGPTLYMTRFTAGDYDFPMDKAVEFLDSFNILADPQARLQDGQDRAKRPAPADG